MEEIASQGYAVFALGQPGIASGVLFPNGDVVNVDADFIAGPSPVENETNPDIETRYNSMEQRLERDNPFPLRCRDDMLALADFLDDSLNNATSWIGQLIGEESALSLIYMGFSYGGAAAGSAGQEDKRAKGAVNLDGLHQSLDLFGRAIQVPFLTFATEIQLNAYYNEFFYEPLESMGTNPNVTRVAMPENVTHPDLTDLKFLAQELRQALGLDEIVDGPHLHDILVSFCLGFLDTHTGKTLDWAPSQSFSQFNDTKPVDVSYVADWANGLSISPTATPTMSSAPMSIRTMFGSGPGIAVINMMFTIAAALLFW
jgi:dienelactone hydrolase